MHSLRSDTDTNTLYMTFSEDVTVANLARLERTALVAARVLDRGFVLVTDISDCTGVTGSAIDRIDSVIDQLGQFGLDNEVRVVDETTPVAVRRQFDDVGGKREIDLRTSDEALADTAADRASL